MDNSFIEISNALESFVDLMSDDVLQTYSIDDFTMFQANNYVYPMLWATPINMNVVDGKVTYKIQVSIMEKVGEKQELAKVLSDNAITVTELLTHFNDQSEKCFYSSVTNTDFKPFFRRNEKVCGWQGELVFELRYQADTTLIRYK